MDVTPDVAIRSRTNAAWVLVAKVRKVPRSPIRTHHQHPITPSVPALRLRAPWRCAVGVDDRYQGSATRSVPNLTMVAAVRIRRP
jgi:hypothetical protein